MKSELEELIEYYEAERNRLDAQMKDSLDEEDYLAADFFAPALRAVNVQLDILYKLKDPTYMERKTLLGSKGYFENKFFDSPQVQNLMKTEREREAINKWRENELESIKSKLDKLKDFKPNPSLDKEEFDDAIYDLVEGKISAFKLYLKKGRNLYLNFERIGDGLAISFPPEEPNEGYNYFSFERILHMGFHRNEEKRRYEYLYDIDSFSNSIFLKTLVARIVFEVFAGWEIDNPAHIEITI